MEIKPKAINVLVAWCWVWASHFLVLDLITLLYLDFSLHKKWSFQLRISSVNITKSAGNCGFGHIYWRNSQWKTSFLCSVTTFSLKLFSRKNLIIVIWQNSKYAEDKAKTEGIFDVHTKSRRSYDCLRSYRLSFNLGRVSPVLMFTLSKFLPVQKQSFWSVFCVL